MMHTALKTIAAFAATASALQVKTTHNTGRSDNYYKCRAEVKKDLKDKNLHIVYARYKITTSADCSIGDSNRGSPINNDDEFRHILKKAGFTSRDGVTSADSIYFSAVVTAVLDSQEDEDKLSVNFFIAVQDKTEGERKVNAFIEKWNESTAGIEFVKKYVGSRCEIKNEIVVEDSARWINNTSLRGWDESAEWGEYVEAMCGAKPSPKPHHTTSSTYDDNECCRSSYSRDSSCCGNDSHHSHSSNNSDCCGSKNDGPSNCDCACQCGQGSGNGWCCQCPYSDDSNDDNNDNCC